MRINDTTSAVSLAVAFDSQRTGTRIAMPLYRRLSPSRPRERPVTRQWAPARTMRKRPARSRCAVSEPSCQTVALSGSHARPKRSSLAG